MPAANLQDPSLLIIFAYAPAGLGHLRVTDALYHGLPSGTTPPLLLGSQDTSITAIHRFMSFHPVTRAVTEWLERGVLEDITTALYRSLLRSKTHLLYQQLTTILDEHYVHPARVLAVATHFALAHQLSVLKSRLEHERNIKMRLVVQVTDDSPHHIWYVPGADCIFVPSHTTRRKLEAYAREVKLSNVRFDVIPYPLHPRLTKPVSLTQMHNRLEQTSITTSVPIHTAIPISGAAVGTDFFTILIDQLHAASSRFLFYVISKDVPYTQKFINEMRRRAYVTLSISDHDRNVVSMYEQLYATTPISLEITKPSEQAFKALFDCTQQGASILLFSEPVGRQEHDNLHFLRRHHLIPADTEEQALWKHSRTNNSFTGQEQQRWLLRASRWRGICLPHNPQHAAQFIYWLLRNGILRAMMTCKITPAAHGYELHSAGTVEFWKRVNSLLDT